MSWGNKIVWVFICFALLMGTLVYKCTQQNFELVSKDYYSDELKYQDKIEGTINANKISDVILSQDDKTLFIQFPKELQDSNIAGTIWFYCTAKASNDRKFPISVDTHLRMLVDKKNLAKTRYLAKISWQTNGQLYFKEIAISID